MKLFQIIHACYSYHLLKIWLIGTTATLRTGTIQNDICLSLGLKAGEYHLIRRSNMRHDICLIFREMRSGIGSKSFPELDWVLHSGRHTVVFCKTIALGIGISTCILPGDVLKAYQSFWTSNIAFVCIIHSTGHHTMQKPFGLSKQQQQCCNHNCN